tara:strand:+ start:524 stop:913 length:390 start_codon:yes stop_codon:yes gene_type:complete
MSPWTVTRGADGEVLVTNTTTSGLDDDVCLVYGGNDNDDNRALHHADLIAMAPAMYKLLARAADAVEELILHATDGGTQGTSLWSEENELVEKTRSLMNTLAEGERQRKLAKIQEGYIHWAVDQYRGRK